MVLYPEAMGWMDVLKKLEVPGKPKAYVILNAFIHPAYDPVEPGLLTIADKTFSSLIRTQGLGDLDRIYLATQRDGIDFYLANPPNDLPHHGAEPFDPVYMQGLFDRGYEMAVNGYPWETSPPHFSQPR